MLDRISDITTRLVDEFKTELSESGRISPYRKRIVPEYDRQDFFLVLNALVAREVIRYRFVDDGERYIISQFNIDKFNLFCAQFRSDNSPSAVFSDISRLKQKFLYTLSAPMIKDSDFSNGMHFFDKSEETGLATVDPSNSEVVSKDLIRARFDYDGGFNVYIGNDEYHLRGKSGRTEDILSAIFLTMPNALGKKITRHMLATATDTRSIESKSLKTVFRKNSITNVLAPFVEIGSNVICIHPEADLTEEQVALIKEKSY